MSVLCGVYSFDGDERLLELARALSERAAGADPFTLSPLEKSRNFSLYFGQHDDRSGKILTWTDDAGRRTLVWGDVSYAGDAYQRRLVADCGHKALPDLEIPGKWIAISLDLGSPEVRIANDFQGVAWLYLANLPEGILFSTHFGALAEVLRGRLSLDSESALLELSLTFQPSQHTLFREIELLQPGCYLAIRPGGLTKISQKRAAYGNRFFGASTDQKYRALDTAFSEAFSAYAAMELDRNCVLSLSAGFDSRFCLANFLEQGSKLDCVTFGHPESVEVERARDVAHRADCTSTVFTASSWSWEQWREAALILGNLGLVQWSGWSRSWAEFLRARCDGVIIGYGGDNFSGKNLVGEETDPFPPRFERWFDRWWNPDFHRGDDPLSLLRPGVGRRLHEVAWERIHALAAQADYCSDHQRLHYLNCLGRNRRRAASQSNFLTRFVTPFTPLYDEKLLEVFMNLPNADLLGQGLYKRYGESRFPHLFDKEEAHSQAMPIRAFRKSARLAQKALGIGEQGQRPLVIDRRRAILSNTAEIIPLVRRQGEKVADWLDPEVFCQIVTQYDQHQPLGSGTVICLVNLFLLLELA